MANRAQVFVHDGGAGGVTVNNFDWMVHVAHMQLCQGAPSTTHAIKLLADQGSVQLLIKGINRLPDAVVDVLQPAFGLSPNKSSNCRGPIGIEIAPGFFVNPTLVI